MLSVTLASIVYLGIGLRLGFFLFGLYQDAHLHVRYTDIDYLVFSDAAQYVYEGKSPYLRETYRYTPLLAWMLVPNAWGGLWTHYGKVVFMLCDILTGVLISQTLGSLKSRKSRVLLALWLLNPMVITISTRGSSESVLTCIVMLAVASLLRDNLVASALWLGLAIHFKIYPIIYLPAILLYLAPRARPFVQLPVLNWINRKNLQYLVLTLASLTICNWVMFNIYGYEFLYHSYLYHLTRVDHRHNFSVFNVALYYKSARDFLPATSLWIDLLTRDIEKAAFVPQLLIAAVFLPLKLARRNLTSCLFVQTFAFVALNKVITSQYFIWFLIFLPHYLATSKLTKCEHAKKGLAMLVLWIVSQGCWLLFAYKLEFLGESTFDGGLLYSSIFFFLTNCWMLGEFIELA